MDSQIFNFSFGVIKFENSLMIGVYVKNLTIDLDLAKEMVRERLRLLNGRTYPFLADVRQLKLATKEARDYFAKEGVKGMTALAILIGNPLTVIMANLFITFSKPLVPTKAFRTREQAVKWLQQFTPTEQTFVQKVN